MSRDATIRSQVHLLTASAIAWAVFVVLLWYVVRYGILVSMEAVAASTAMMAQASPVQKYVGVPVRIKIPRIGVDAVVNGVALAADGSMGVPKNPLETAWYKLGARPGKIGSAVIAGHVNWLRGAKGAFANLGKLKPGDTLAVEDEDGKTYAFVVREIRTYDASADASSVFSSTDGKAHLNLITCDGTWDVRAKQYAKRLVVFTDKVTEGKAP